jgi:hypothetical protein
LASLSITAAALIGVGAAMTACIEESARIARRLDDNFMMVVSMKEKLRRLVRMKLEIQLDGKS